MRSLLAVQKRGVALMEPQPIAEREVKLKVEYVYQNRNEALFQGEGNVALYGNLFVNDHGDAVRIQPHNDIPRRVVVAFNTVLRVNGAADRVGDPFDDRRQAIAAQREGDGALGDHARDAAPSASRTARTRC